jgi:hypothetical protein
MEIIGKQRIQQMTAISDLYRPIQEAADTELAKSEAGTELMKDRRALTEEIRDIHEQIESKRLTRLEARRAIRSKRELLKAKHNATWLDAHALNARLQPSVEQILAARNLDWRHQLVWEAEILPFEAILLRPKIADTGDTGTIQQGLGGDDPPAVKLCASKPFALEDKSTWAQPPWNEAFAWPAPAVGIAEVLADATQVGGGAAQAFVGADFDVPAGVTDYVVTADFDVEASGDCYAVLFGAAGCGGDAVISIDKGDGTSTIDSYKSLFSLITAVLWGKNASRTGSMTMSVPFTRSTPSAGQVRVMVGASTHAEAAVLWCGSNGWVRITVNQICLNSA